MLVLNRDLTAAEVPTVRASDLEPSNLPEGYRGRPFGYGGHTFGWATIWHFALTFDVAAYAEGTGTQLDGMDALRRVSEAAALGTIGALHLRDLRAALAALYWSASKGSSVEPDQARLVDAILDAAYARLSAGGTRPNGRTGPYEPEIGIFGASHGSGQHRLSFQARESARTRDELFDRAAGLLLREVDPDVIVSALYLYPPAYSEEDIAAPPTHIFMILLEHRPPKGDGRAADLGLEYERLTHLVAEDLSAPGTSFP